MIMSHQETVNAYLHSELCALPALNAYLTLTPPLQHTGNILSQLHEASVCCRELVGKTIDDVCVSSAHILSLPDAAKIIQDGRDETRRALYVQWNTLWERETILLDTFIFRTYNNGGELWVVNGFSSASNNMFVGTLYKGDFEVGSFQQSGLPLRKSCDEEAIAYLKNVIPEWEDCQRVRHGVRQGKPVTNDDEDANCVFIYRTRDGKIPVIDMDKPKTVIKEADCLRHIIPLIVSGNVVEK